MLPKAGTYRIVGTARVERSAVILRGSGAGAHGTVLSGDGKAFVLVAVAGYFEAALISVGAAENSGARSLRQRRAARRDHHGRPGTLALYDCQ